jgi:hypothetical protein
VRKLFGVLLLSGVLLPLLGCDPPKVKEYDGPTVPKFVGKILHEGKPVTFSDDEIPSLQLMFQKTRRPWGVPLKQDGTFDLGWMPIGKYVVVLERREKANPRNNNKYLVDQNFEISEGKTEYVFELGKDWKP